MSRVLVTGGAGFIGSHLVDGLLARGDDVVALDSLATGRRENLDPGVELVVGDVRDHDTVRRVAARGFDAVLHVAGQASIARSFQSPHDDLSVNVGGTIEVLEACVAEGIPRIVYASSMTAYGEPSAVPISEREPAVPVSYYGVTKLAGERYVQITGAERGLAATSLRMFNVYGERQSLTNPYQGVLAIFIGNVLRGEPITIHSDGRQTRDFVYVGDVVRAWLAALDRPESTGHVINVGSGRETSIAELATAVLAAFGESAESWEVRRTGAQAGDQRRSAADIALATELLDWSPQIPLAQGMARTIAAARPGQSPPAIA